MATFEYYQQQLEEAKKRRAEAKEKLKTFENDAEGGEWLKTLRKKACAGRLNDDERYEKRRLEEKATRLEQAVETRTQAAEEWGGSYVSSPLSQVTTS